MYLVQGAKQRNDEVRKKQMIRFTWGRLNCVGILHQA